MQACLPRANSRSVRRWWAVAAVWLAGCAVPSEQTLPPLGTVRGNVTALGERRGSAFLFLTRSPAGQFTLPTYATAVSRDRWSAEDPHFVFARVQPGAYSLAALHDVDGNFAPDIDVLTQPTEGDETSDPVTLDVLDQQTTLVDVPFGQGVLQDPPAFFVTDQTGTLFFSDAPRAITLESVAVPPLEGTGGFRFSYVDASSDGFPDDSDGDGVPEVFPRVFLRLSALASEAGSPSGATAPQILVPLSFTPLDLAALFLSGGAERRVLSLTLLYFPGTALQLDTAADGTVVLTSLPSPPAGAYELWVVERSGQFWKLPNALGADVPSQALEVIVEN